MPALRRLAFISRTLAFLAPRPESQSLRVKAVLCSTAVALLLPPVLAQKVNQQKEIGSEQTNSTSLANLSIPKTETQASILKTYPTRSSSVSEDLASLRNPFSPPTGFGLSQASLAPIIKIKGFSGRGDTTRPVAFLSVNNASDTFYQIGQDVGNGYRIVSILPGEKRVIISNGMNRYDYKLKVLKP